MKDNIRQEINILLTTLYICTQFTVVIVVHFYK